LGALPTPVTVLDVVEILDPWVTLGEPEMGRLLDGTLTWLPVDTLVEVAAGTGCPIPIGLLKVAFGCVATGAPDRVPEEVDDEEAAAEPALLAKAGSEVQTTSAAISSASLLGTMFRSCSWKGLLSERENSSRLKLNFDEPGMRWLNY